MIKQLLTLVKSSLQNSWDFFTTTELSTLWSMHVIHEIYMQKFGDGSPKKWTRYKETCVCVVNCKTCDEAFLCMSNEQRNWNCYHKVEPKALFWRFHDTFERLPCFLVSESNSIADSLEVCVCFIAALNFLNCFTVWWVWVCTENDSS